MHAKKLSPNGAARGSEPDLSQVPTRKVDSVSSLAAEMMLRHADEGAEPPAREAEALASSPPPPRSAVRPVAVRPGREGRGRLAVRIVAGLLGLALCVAAVFVATR